MVWLFNFRERVKWNPPVIVQRRRANGWFTFVHPSKQPSIYTSVHHPSIRLYVHPSIHLSRQPYIYPVRHQNDMRVLYASRNLLQITTHYSIRKTPSTNHPNHPIVPIPTGGWPVVTLIHPSMHNMWKRSCHNVLRNDDDATGMGGIFCVWVWIEGSTLLLAIFLSLGPMCGAGFVVRWPRVSVCRVY